MRPPRPLHSVKPTACKHDFPGLTEFERFTFDYRNRVAVPAMTAAGVPVIPVHNALVPLGREHVNARGPEPDCTHFCEPSTALVHMASAVLNAVAASYMSLSARSPG